MGTRADLAALAAALADEPTTPAAASQTPPAGWGGLAAPPTGGARMGGEAKSYTDNVARFAAGIRRRTLGFFKHPIFDLNTARQNAENKNQIPPLFRLQGSTAKCILEGRQTYYY